MSRGIPLDITDIKTPKPLAASTVKKSQNRRNKESSFSSNDSLRSLPKEFDLSSEFNNLKQSLTALPSRYFKPTTTEKSNFCLTKDSTINESDLNDLSTSTPRPSLGIALRKCEETINNPNIDFGTVVNEVTSVVSDANKLLLEDEEKFVLPQRNEEFSFGRENSLPFDSLGDFCQRKPDDLLDFLSKSPKSQPEPVPLIDLSRQSIRESLNTSQILQLLSNSNLPTEALVEYFLTGKKQEIPTDNSSFEIKSQNFTSLENSQNSTCSRKSAGDRGNVSNAIDQTVSDKDYWSHLNVDESSAKDYETVSKLNNKENNKSLTSIRSVSSLGNLPDGKLPIEADKSELVWACTQPGQTGTQTFSIRNRSAKRIRLKLTVTNPAFKLLDHCCAVPLVLHQYESKTITVSFSPIYLGPAIDEIRFSSVSLEQTAKQTVALFGYGGLAAMKILMSKNKAGESCLTLGETDAAEKSIDFCVGNEGTIPAFAIVQFHTSKYGNYRKLHIHPSKLILLPKETKQVTVSLCPSKDDYKEFQAIPADKKVLDIGKLKVISGAEIVRQRIKRLHKIAVARQLELNPVSEQISVLIPGEASSDVQYFKESIGAMKELCEELSHDEIDLTLDKVADPNATITNQLSTTVFQTLTREPSVFDNSSHEVTVFENLKDFCTVEPNVILLRPDKSEDILIFQSKRSKPTHFDINSHPEGLTVLPKSGTVGPGDTIAITVKCTKIKTVDYKVEIFVDCQVFRVDVKVRII